MTNKKQNTDIEEVVEELLEKGVTVAKRTTDMSRPVSDGHEVRKLLKHALTTYAQQRVNEERQFILNILDGIDTADKQMGNKSGGTEAIRLALKSRII